MRLGFNAGREPGLDDVRAVLRQMKPTSELMKDSIERRRLRLANRARPASAAPSAAPSKGRRLVA